VIIKGGSHSGRGLGAYLFQAKNERAELWGIRGVIPGQTLTEAIGTWQGLAYTTSQQCEKPLYHAQLNPDRPLSREEWDKTFATFEQEMGLENQPRAVIFHCYKGREHVHLVYSRIENGRAISDSWNYLHHEKASRDIEKTLGLEHTQGALYQRNGASRPERRPDEKQTEQGKRTKQDPKAIKAEVSELYASTANGGDFVKALDEAGYTLARGDKRGYVIVDEAGGVHNLNRVAGVKVAELRDHLKGFELDGLPSVEQARDRQDDRVHERESVRDRMEREDPLHAAAIEKAKAEITQSAKPEPKPTKENTAEPPRPSRSRARHESRDDGAIGSLESTAGRSVEAIGTGIVGVLEAATEAIENAVLDIFDPTPPKPVSREEIAARETEREEAEKVRAAKALEERRVMLKDYARRRSQELEEEQERTQTKKPDKGRSRGR
jgi:hypothetical protein